MGIEKRQLFYQQVIRVPGKPQGINDLTSDAGGKFFLLKHPTDFLALLSLVATAAIQVKCQVQHQASLVCLALYTADIVTVLGSEFKIEIRIASTH